MTQNAGLGDLTSFSCAFFLFLIVPFLSYHLFTINMMFSMGSTNSEHSSHVFDLLKNLEHSKHIFSKGRRNAAIGYRWSLLIDHLFSNH